MDSQTFIRELKLFFKENKKTVVYSIIIFFILGILLQVGVSMLGSNSSQTTTNETISVKPAAFEVYLENPQTGEPYTNSYILEEFFEKEEWMNWAEENSGVEISDTVERFQEENPEITNGDLLKPISSNRDRSSHVFTVMFNFGNEKENLAIAQTYYELLLSEELAFLQNKNIYTVEPPAVIDSSLLTVIEEAEPSTVVSSEREESPFSIKNLTIILATSLVGGTVLGVVIAFSRSLFSKKINYGFAYSWNEEDIYVNLSNNVSDRTIAQTILQPINNSKIILNQSLSNDFENQVKEEVESITMTILPQISFEKDMLDVNPTLQVDEFIIIISRKETTKKWYNNQRELLKNYPLALIKIVQM